MGLLNRRKEPLYTEADRVAVPGYDDWTLPKHIIDKVRVVADEDNGRYGIELLSQLYYDVWETQITEAEDILRQDEEFIDWAVDVWKLLSSNGYTLTLSEYGFSTFLNDVLKNDSYQYCSDMLMEYGPKGEKLVKRLDRLREVYRDWIE